MGKVGNGYFYMKFKVGHITRSSSGRIYNFIMGAKTGQYLVSYYFILERNFSESTFTEFTLVTDSLSEDEANEVLTNIFT